MNSLEVWKSLFKIDVPAVLIVFGVVLGSMILHELAHGAVAYLLGDRTAKEAGRLSFNPLKHIDPVMSLLVPVLLYMVGAPVFGGAKPVPVNTRNLKGKEWGMAAVAAAGPLMNFLLAFIAFWIGNYSLAFYVDSGYIGVALWQMIVVNLGFMIFNLIPIAPLDGSRILYAVAPDAVRSLMERMEKYGVVVIYALILVLGAAFSQFMSGAIKGIVEFFYWIIGV